MGCMSVPSLSLCGVPQAGLYVRSNALYFVLPSCQKVHHLVISVMFCPVLSHVLTMFSLGWTVKAHAEHWQDKLMLTGTLAHINLASSGTVCSMANISVLNRLSNTLELNNQALSMQNQINSVCRASFLELRRIASICKHLLTKENSKLVNSFYYFSGRLL